MKAYLFVAVILSGISSANADDNQKTDIPEAARSGQRYDVQPVNIGSFGMAIMVDHQSGRTWVLRVEPSATGFMGGTMHWEPLPVSRSNGVAIDPQPE